MRREAARRFAVFRVIERGEQNVFRVEEPIEFLHAARSIRHYTRKGESASGFRHYYAAASDITTEEFELFAHERAENTGRVLGAFKIDFDAGTLATLDSAGKWSQYTIKDVCAAAYHADLRNGESSVKRTERLLNYLDGKGLIPPEPVQTAPNMSMGQMM